MATGDVLNEVVDEMVPPATQQEPPLRISFEQAMAGIWQTVNKLLVTDAGYTHLNKVLKGEIEAPVVKMPTGSKDFSGKQIIAEIDIEAIVKSCPSSEQDSAKTQMLTPWNNHLAYGYLPCLEKMIQFATAAKNLLTQAQS